MKFILKTTSTSYNLEDKIIPVFRKLGFTFSKSTTPECLNIRRATIEMDSIQQLIELIDKVGSEIIIGVFPGKLKEYFIEIYDDYRE